MKEIFDWLREQIVKLHEIELFTIRYVNRDKVHKLINEAEAKWKEDCCEWKPNRYRKSNCYTSCGYAMHYSDSDKYCRHCGKRIKIVEVE